MTDNWKLEDMPAQNGRLAVITGANVGIGFESALALAGLGMEVIIAARNRPKAEEAISRIRQEHPESLVKFMHLDLSSMNSVRNFAVEFHRTHQKLDLLINNAGIMMPPKSLTEDGFESQLATNYLGHFVLTSLLYPALHDTKGSRIVSLSSIAHKFGSIRFDDFQFSNGYSRMKAYSQSKLACLIFAYELDRRLRKAGSAAVSVAAHPGVASTHLGRNMTPVMRYFFPRIGQPARDGALPILRAALDASVTGGEYFGPDGWNEMKGLPVRTGSSKLSKNQEVAARLWKLTEKTTGVKFLS